MVKPLLPLPEKVVAARTTAPSAPKVDPTASLSSLFESQNPWKSEGGFATMGQGGYFGIRGAMPKMPSFRVPVSDISEYI